jgi:hypothetical protein
MASHSQQTNKLVAVVAGPQVSAIETKSSVTLFALLNFLRATMASRFQAPTAL